jgi:EAL domain-containing protein (putative c-di-GMP-specific phosphodiesterase class I)
VHTHGQDDFVKMAVDATQGHEQTGRDQSTGLDLAQALSADHIDVRFLPTVDLRSTRVTGVEALVRWNHPDHGLLRPGAFLQQATASDQLQPLTERVLELAARAGGDWWRSGLKLQLSVNLPVAAFLAPDWKIHDFTSRIVEENRLPANALIFEVTEDVVMLEQASDTLAELNSIGVGISIDDFGMGQFSISRLARLPVDELKIDRSFVAALANEDNRRTVRSMIHLAHQLGLQVVAEGVETAEAWRTLRSMGCERAQGFLIAEPLPAREVPAWLASWNLRARELGSTGRPRRIGNPAPQKPATATA